MRDNNIVDFFGIDLFKVGKVSSNITQKRYHRSDRYVRFLVNRKEEYFKTGTAQQRMTFEK